MFYEAVNTILDEEGGFVNDPADSGGATNRGIIQKTYDAYRTRKGLPTRSVRYSTKIEAIEIYEGIWRDCKASELLNGPNLVHFDFAVNAGNGRAALTLQKAVDVTQDGIIGPKTIAAANTLPPEVLVKTYSDLRRDFYNVLATKRPKDKKFLKGWLARVDRVEKKALLLLKNNGPLPTKSA